MSKPDNTAVRTALWRALHIQVDAKPYIIEDEIGLQLVAPDYDWQERPDMKYTKRLRASIVARARFVEDLIIEENEKGIDQYIILGAGLDTFAQRRPDPLWQPRHLHGRPPGDAAAPARDATRLPGPVRLAVAAHDRRPGHHRRAAGA